MKKILLITNSLFEYRYEVYNEFIRLFLQHTYNFKILIINDSKRKIIKTNDVNFIHTGSGIKELKNTIDHEEPDFIISFITPTNKMLWFLFLYSKINKIPNITWTHGVNLQNPDSEIKGIVYRFIHKISSALILYSKNELKYISNQYHFKTFIANNTINFNSIPNIVNSKEEIKEKLGIQYDKTVLFVGRMQKRKRIEVLIKIFKEARFQEYGLLIVGPGFNEYYEKQIVNQTNIIYLGAIFDSIKVNEIFKAADLFCIPGTNGLGINQAMYWGLPCLTLNVHHSPEIAYLENNVTGYMIKTKDELADKIFYLLENNTERLRVSINAKNRITSEASIGVMFKGFLNAVNFLNK